MWGQIFFMTNSSVGMIIFLQWYEPFESRLDKNMETFNEVISLFTIYLMMGMSDAEPSAATRNIYGIFFIVVILFYLAVHMTNMCLDQTC